MYEMLTGHLPFKGEYDQVIIYSILDKKPEGITKLNPKIPLELEQIVSRALEKDVDSRYQSIDEMLADLHRFKKESSISTNTVSVVKQNKNRKKIKTAIISIFILVFAFAAFYLIKPILFGEDKTNIPISIAVVSFENQSGDSTYNYLQKAIPNLLITNLEQSNHLQVTTWERMHDLLKQMNENEVVLINKDLGFEICRL
jgi:serine/threonine protein kinase